MKGSIDPKMKKKKAKAVKLDNAVFQEYEKVLAKIDNYNSEELGVLMKKYDIRSPATGGKILSPVVFNLMFQTSTGPLSNNPAYLRGETAQSQFSNFQKLFDFNNEAMPPHPNCICFNWKILPK